MSIDLQRLSTQTLFILDDSRWFNIGIAHNQNIDKFGRPIHLKSSMRQYRGYDKCSDFSAGMYRPTPTCLQISRELRQVAWGIVV
jgi:hypothetical protein